MVPLRHRHLDSKIRSAYDWIRAGKEFVESPIVTAAAAEASCR